MILTAWPLNPKKLVQQPEVGFDGLNDLSPFTAAFYNPEEHLFLTVKVSQRRPKCREGVTEIGNVLNGGQFTAPFMAVTLIVSAKSILFIPSPFTS